MSLITLTSEDIHSDGSNRYGAAALQCNFKEGIRLRQGDELSLVNINIHVPAKVTIVLDANDRLEFIIGGTTTYIMKTATVPEGSYTAPELAIAIGLAMNTQTPIGVYRQFLYTSGVFAGWQGVYTPPLLAAAGSYTFKCVQAEVADVLGDGGGINTYSFRRGYPEMGAGIPTIGIEHPSVFVSETDADNWNFTQEGVGDAVTNMHSMLGSSGDYDAKATGSLIAGEKGIFGNDGVFELNIAPVFGIEKPAAAAPGSGALITDLRGFRRTSPDADNEMEIDDDGNLKDMHWEVPGAPEIAAGYNWQSVDDSGGTDFNGFWHLFDSPDGRDNGMWLLRDGTATTNAVPGVADGLQPPVDAVTGNIIYANLSVDAPLWFIDPDDRETGIGSFSLRPMTPHEVDAATGDAIWTSGGYRGTIPITISKKGGTPGQKMRIQSTSKNLGYARTNVGFCRQQLYNGTGADARDDQIAAGPSTVYPDTAATRGIAYPGFDVVVQVENGDLGAADQPVVSCHKMTERGPVPFPTFGWRDGGAVVLPHDPWAGAPITAGSYLQVQVKVTGNVQYSVSISRTAGVPPDPVAPVFAETVLLWSSGTTPPVSPGTGVPAFGSVTKEKHYQLRPCAALSRGGFYHPLTYRTSLGCVFDAIAHPDSLYGTDNPVADDPEAESVEDEFATLGAKQTLVQIIKYDTVSPIEIGDGPGQLPTQFAPPNLANIASVLGMPNFQIFPNGGIPEPLFTSVDEPAVTTLKPELAIEMPQFNIKSYNGYSTDSGKVLAVVPGSELTTGDTLGALFFAPPFKIPIALNLKEDMTLYQLTSLLKTTDGRMLTSLRQPTTLTLLLEQGPESKMQRAMAAAMSQLRGQAEDRQSNAIATAGLDFARV